jgi:hypothetical protein
MTIGKMKMIIIAMMIMINGRKPISGFPLELFMFSIAYPKVVGAACRYRAKRTEINQIAIPFPRLRPTRAPAPSLGPGSSVGTNGKIRSVGACVGRRGASCDTMAPSQKEKGQLSHLENRGLVAFLHNESRVYYSTCGDRPANSDFTWA